MFELTLSKRIKIEKVLPMKPISILIIVLIASQVKGQYIKIDNGIVFSSYRNSKDLSLLSSKKLTRYSFLAGVDYLEKNFLTFPLKPVFIL